ncbi:MAG: heat-inducible transcriptional repressor HrcA [Peptococcaceae bacterium]|nr:heat-inducible transcriptional repressor HrcA [Peptococcaceae bacterium]
MLDERKEKILAAIVTDFIETAEPVGSRTISKKYDIGFSSATIRNEMSDLEDMGYIVQPHTSAGRIPTDIGYRYYVDRLMFRTRRSYTEEKQLNAYIRSQASMDNERMHAILKRMADVTGYTAMLVIPEADVTKPLLSMLELIYLMPERGLMVVVTDDERVEQRLIDLPKGFGPKELNMVNGVLSHYLRGLSVAHWHRPLIEFLIDQMGTASAFVHDLLDILNEILSRRQQKQVMVEGTLNVLSYAEFQDIELLRPLLMAFGNEDDIAGFFTNMPEKGITIRIGDENTSAEINGCSMVVGNYSIGKNVGHLALIGPKRMNYIECVAMVEAVLSGLEQVYTRLEKSDARKNALSTVVAHDGDWTRCSELAIFKRKY